MYRLKLSLNGLRGEAEVAEEARRDTRLQLRLVDLGLIIRWSKSPIPNQKKPTHISQFRKNLKPTPKTKCFDWGIIYADVDMLELEIISLLVLYDFNWVQFNFD